MSMYIRRFTEDPGLEVLLDIESVNIIDQDPPTATQAIGTGTAIVVGEFENGPFATPTEVLGPTDLQNVFGGFGYIYDGVKANNPCARSRHADSAILPEYWNGNGMVGLNGKKFKRLILSRADTSVGEVQFARLASLVGAFKPSYDLEPGQILRVKTDLAPVVSVTFSATAGVVTSVGGVFTGVVAGDYIDLAYDGGATFRTVFLTGDNTIGGVVSRINQYAGFVFASSSAGQLRLTGRRRGTGGAARIVGGSGTLVTTFGLSVGSTAGTGNVADIDAVLLAEVNTLVHAAIATLYVTRDADQRIMIYNADTSGVATVQVESALTTAIAFEFPLDTNGLQATATDNVILPAGTRVRNAGGTEWVTMQSLTLAATEAGGWHVKVRHALDDGTGLGALTSTVNVLPYPPSGVMLAVLNPLPLTVAKTELEIDSAYFDALAATLDLNTVAREANMVGSARQSNNCRRFVVQNAKDASSMGCFGRVAVLRPPLGTTRAVARGAVEPGVGAYRDERGMYCFPGVQTYVPAIALRGTAGGEGFTASGYVNAGADLFLLSVMSRLASEENPGQLTTFLDAVIGLESGAEYAGWVMDDYKAFKRAGIVAARLDDGIAIFQSGVTSVDPGVLTAKTRISRRRMADEIQDTLAKRAKNYGKKVARAALRNAFISDCAIYMEGLLSKEDKTKQRIASYEIDGKSANTPEILARGMCYVIVRARTYPSLDSIVIQTEIGENVNLTEV